MRIEPNTTIIHHAQSLLAELRTPGNHILVTEQGESAAYLVEADTYDAMQHRFALLGGIALGEQAIREGRTYSHAEARAKMQRWQR